MSIEQGTQSVREQLIIAGIEELENHGIADFSLRRVATACNISCAAPYRHFEGKEQLIGAIFEYIHAQLNLLLEQVAEVFGDNPEKKLVESCIAYIRFCRANPHFRAIITLSGDALPLKDVVKPLLSEYLPHISPKECTRRALTVRSFIYGVAVALESGELSDEDLSVDDVREGIIRIIGGY